ncbi:MAG: hypothetical protein IV100_23700 [Myxococcales bacterium]|nr:hypothetical protein [Myxococcales bacterium]
MREYLKALTAPGATTRVAAVLAAWSLTGAGCKKSEPEPAAEAPAATAVAEASLEAEKGQPDEPADRRLAKGKPGSKKSAEAESVEPDAGDEAGVAERPRTRDDIVTPPPTPRARRVPSRPPMAAEPPGEGGMPEAPVAHAGTATAPEAEAAPAADPLAEADLPTGAGIVPGTRPGGGRPPPARPGAGRPAMGAMPPTAPPGDPMAPAFDEGLDTAPTRADRNRPRPARPMPAADPSFAPPGDPSMDPMADPSGAPLGDPSGVGQPPAIRPGPGAARGELPADPGAGMPVATSPGETADEASARRAGGLPTKAKPNAELLLRKQDLVEILDFKKNVDVHALPGLDDDARYDAIYWGSPDGSEYHVGLQIWKPRFPIEAQRRYSQMVRSYPNAEETTAIGSKAFLGFWNDFLYLVFMTSDNASPTVIALTCDRRVCDTAQKLVLLATQVYDRLKPKETTPTP